jgi:K+-transporting ATPase c subunit
MKNLTTFLLIISIKTILLGDVSNATTYYVSTTGSDSNPGTLSQPFATWEHGMNVLNAGDVLYIRGGTYHCSKATTSDLLCYMHDRHGTSSQPILVSAYPGEIPIWDLTNQTWTNTAASGIQASNCSYIHFYGLKIMGPRQYKASGQYPTNDWCFALSSCDHVTIENSEVSQGMYGFGLNNSTNVTFLNCDAHEMYNPYGDSQGGDPTVIHYAYGGASGFNCSGWTNTSTNILYKGCRAYWCSDNGFQTFGTDGIQNFDNCWAFDIGYREDHTTTGGDGMGFKVGPTATDKHTTIIHTLNNCLAFKNRQVGFDQNVATLSQSCIDVLYNCTAWSNGSDGFKFGDASPYIAHILKNNVGFQNGLLNADNSCCGSGWVQATNSWNGFSVSSSDFISLDPTGTDGARQPDGSLPSLNFLHLASGSKLIDAGTNVGLAFSGTAPDIDAFESGSLLTATNQPPIAKAGVDQNITLPTNTVTLSGSGSDPDGTISSYQWTKVSGPSQYTIVSPTQAQTTVNNLAQGIYLFELKVTDNAGATGKDTVQVTVNAAPANQPPTANAGADINITLPVNSATLNGSGTDPDGTIASYQWTKVSGPSQYTIVSPTQAQTTVNNLAQGIYLFELKVTDNAGATGKDTVQVTVNAAPANQPPTANAGTDINITLPVNSATLNGSGTDPDGTIASYQWTKVSGPSQYTIVSPTQAQTTINNLAQGIYLFELKVTDNAGATGKDTVQVTVNAAPANQPPTANAGLDINITLPTNSVTLSGSGSDPDGTIASYQWAKISGPSQYNIVSPTQAKTSVSNLAQGIYEFELTVTDNAGASGKDTVQVTVNAAPANQSPTANAGLDINITLPTNSVTLSGSGSDPDGTIASYQWTQVAGPSKANISSPTQPQTAVKNLNQGIYLFELKVTDNLGATGKDSVQVTVNGSTTQTRSPKADAGGNKKLTLPTNSTTLSGTGTNGSGSITTYSWKKISGPAEYTITSPTLAQTTVKDLSKGTYQFELTVTDNLGLSGKDTAQITVVAAAPPNHSPVADAGSDIFITLPTNSVSLSGTGTDADGTIASYKWTKVSGPTQFTLTSSTDAQTTLTDLVSGDYEFELKVTDNLGAVGRDTVKVIVSERLVSIAKIFPNPASSLINIQMIAATMTNNTTIRIYDAKGIVVHQENFVRQQQTMTKQISIDNLPRGVYYLEMNIDINKIMTLMFVKQ